MSPMVAGAGAPGHLATAAPMTNLGTLFLDTNEPSGVVPARITDLDAPEALTMFGNG